MIQKRIKRSDAEWSALIQSWRTNGMTVRAWCGEHNISAATFMISQTL